METANEQNMQKGTLRVCVKDRDGAKAVIENARVAIYSHMVPYAAGEPEAEEPKEKRKGRKPEYERSQPAVAGRTGADGCFEAKLLPGTYTVEVTAFWNTQTKTVEIHAGCVTEECLEIPIGLAPKSFKPKDDCTQIECSVFSANSVVKLQGGLPDHLKDKVGYIWAGSSFVFIGSSNSQDAFIRLFSQGGTFSFALTISDNDGARITASGTGTSLPREEQPIGGDVRVTMRRTAAEVTDDLALWVVIRKSTEAVSFNNYLRFMNHVLCGEPLSPEFSEYERDKIEGTNGKLQRFRELRGRRFLPFNDADAYRILKIATEAFLIVNCGVVLEPPFPFDQEDLDLLVRRVNVDRQRVDPINDLWARYLEAVNGIPELTLPYLALIRQKLADDRIKLTLLEDADPPNVPGIPEECFGILRHKLTEPCLLELIWSYWHEEGMLVQTMNAITRRFQNIRGAGDRDPLANLEVDPLRPLNNLLWGYLQDEQHRLSVVRRTYEYDHHYGLRLEGKAVPEPRTADSRSKLLEAFHNLLNRCDHFFKQDDDTTVIADGFPLVNALKEVHLILSQGAHNQFGDLPSTARQEMLIQEWLLARPEFREFLPTRIMVAYPEPWMDRVDAMKKLQGWTDTSVLHFRNLGQFGEQIMLSIRFGAWSDVNDPAQGANWARFWRPEIQGYTHAYRAVTGVDLTLDKVDYTLPSVHLRNRLAAQMKAR